LLEQLRQAWPALGENELIIDDKRAPAKSTPPPAEEKPAEPPPEVSAAVGERRSTHWRVAPVGVPTRFAELRLVAADEPAEEEAAVEARPAAPQKPPITITVTPDGRLVIASTDNAALDRLEGFVDELAPPASRFKMFRLTYAKAVDVYYNLKEYFEEELTGENGQMLDWWGMVQDTGPKDEGMRLSKRRTLRLIWDPPSNSILVANASPSQLYEIERLIKEYDQPASADSTRTRSTGVIKVRYSRASKIAAAIKDVYRDLLSSKDKEFDSKERKDQGSARESVTVIRYGGGGGEGEGDPKKTGPLKVGFEGALSIGADDVSNVLLVSAQEEIFDGVVQMIHRLDEEARPRTTVVVHRVSSQIDPKSLQKALTESLGTAWLGGRPEKPEAAPSTEQKPPGEQAKPAGEGGGSNGD
jgi:type II secretory pathway component GspD/PulD (secretin)